MDYPAWVRCWYRREFCGMEFCEDAECPACRVLKAAPYYKESEDGRPGWWPAHWRWREPAPDLMAAVREVARGG